MVKSIDWMETSHFGATLSSKNAGESFKTHLKIPADYEFRNQIIMGTKDRTRETDDLGYMHERYDQYYKGVKIEHSDIRARYLNDMLVSLNGEYIDVQNIDISIVLSMEAAIQKAKDHIGAKKFIWEDEKECEFLKSSMENPPASCYPNPETVICRNYFAPEDTLFHVAYKVDIRAIEPYSSDYVYVDAKTGKILNTISRIYYVNGTADTRYSGRRTISTQQNGAVFRLRGYDNSRSIETYNMQHGSTYANTDYTDNNNDWTTGEFHNLNRDDAGLEAHWSAMMTWDYFKNVHNRNSYNGSGGTIKNYVNANLVGLGLGLGNNNNAFWEDGTNRITYGTGAGTPLIDTYVTLDVVAHEFGHGLINNTAKLVYQGESGAITEGINDIWGACVSDYANKQFSGLNKNIWLHRIDVGSANRSLISPNTFGDPDTYLGPNWFNINGCAPSNQNDQCGVHTNSGVMSHWFYLLSEGGSGTNGLSYAYDVVNIGIDKAANILYRALTDHMTKNENYFNARTHTIQVAADLYGTSSNEVISVTNAWHAAGVGNMSITGPDFVCYDGGSFKLNNAPSGIVYWTLSNNNLFTVNASTNPTTVTRIGTTPGVATLSAHIGSVNGTVVATKTIVACVPAISGPDVVCIPGSTFTLLYPPPPGNISWSVTGSFALSATTGNPIAVTATTGNVNGTLTATIGSIVINKAITRCPPPFSINGPDQVCTTATYSISTGKAATWNVTPPNYFSISPTSGGVSAIVTALGAGSGGTVLATVDGYIVNKTIKRSCGKSSDGSSYVLIYHNPVSDILTIEIDAGAAQSMLPVKAKLTFDVHLLDNQGNLLRQQQTKGGTVEFNVANLPDGIYYLHVYDGVNSAPEMLQILVEH